MNARTNEIKSTESKRKRARLSEESTSINEPPEVEEEILVNTNKGRRVRDESTPRSSSDRINSLRSKLTELYNEYPELNDINECHIIMQKLKYKQQKLENEETCPLYKLPQDLFNKCLSFLDKSYNFVAPVSKHFHASYMMTFGGSTETAADFEGLSKEAGVYLVETFWLEFSSEEHKNNVRDFLYEGDTSFRQYSRLSFTFSDYLVHKAARQGNLEMFTYFLENGHDLLRAQGKNWTLFRKVGENGHLHILQYLKEQHYFFRGFCYSAIGASKGGQVDIIEWIHNEIGCFSNENAAILVDECIFEAAKHGQVEVLKWFYKNVEDNDYDPWRVIGSANLNTIQFFIEKDSLTNYATEDLEETIIETDSIDIIKYFVEKGFQFSIKSTQTAAECGYVEILKYLISIGIEWRENEVSDDVFMDSFELMKLRFERTRAWWNGASIVSCMRSQPEKFNIGSLKYLLDNNCPWESRRISRVSKFLDTAMSLERIDILKYIVHKMSGIPGLKFIILRIALDYGWLEGFKYTIQNLEDCLLPSLNKALISSPNLEFLKFCKSHSMKWDYSSYFSIEEISTEILEIAILKDWDLVKWVTSEVHLNVSKNTHILKIAQYFDFRCDVLQHLYNTGFSTKDALITAIEYMEVKAVKSLVEIGFEVNQDIFSYAIKSFDCEPTDKDLEILSFLVRQRCPQKKVFR